MSASEGREPRPAWLPQGRLVVGVLAYAAVASSFQPFTWPMRVAVGVAAVAVVGLAVQRGWLSGLVWPDRVRAGSGGRSSSAWTGLAVWLLLLSVFAVFQLAVWSSNPRDVYPTLSSLASVVFDIQWVRIAAFATWLWVGWWLVER